MRYQSINCTKLLIHRDIIDAEVEKGVRRTNIVAVTLICMK